MASWIGQLRSVATSVLVEVVGLSRARHGNQFVAAGSMQITGVQNVIELVVLSQVPAIPDGEGDVAVDHPGDHPV